MRYRIKADYRQKPRIGSYELGMQLETKSPYKLVFLDSNKRERANRLIQVLHDPDGMETRAKAFFEREVAALRHLSAGETANLVPKLYDSGRTFRTGSSNPFYYVVVKFLKGQTLFSGLPIWIRNLSINGNQTKVSYKRGDFKDIYDQQAKSVRQEDYIRAALDVIEVVDVLRQIHKIGVVHGDVTPSNVLSVNGRKNLIDFEHSNIDGFEYSQPLPYGSAMRYADPNTDIRIQRIRESDLFSVGCLINDLLPFPIGRNQQLSEFLANAYEIVDAMDALPIDEFAAAMSELVKVDREGFVKRMEESPKEAERYLFALSALMTPPARVLDLENRDVRLYRSDRYHLTQAVITRGELETLAKVLKLEPAKRMQEIGRGLVEEQSERMTTDKLHEELQPVKKDLLALIS